jgi:metal-responsive CopG/Arc/MetJ family transcriptional regulator
MIEREKLMGVSVTLPETMIKQVDQRVAELDLTRSQYFRRLARKDLSRQARE